MRVSEALLVDGTNRFCILTYGIFADLDFCSAHEHLLISSSDNVSQIFALRSENWKNGVLLSEISVLSEDDISQTVAIEMLRMFRSGSCIASFCMFDGSFGTYDDIFSDELASYTYAVCFAANEPIIVSDASVLKLDAWRAIMNIFRLRLRSEAPEAPDTHF